MTLFSRLCLLALIVPFVLAHNDNNNCGSGSFFWDKKKWCLPNGGPKDSPKPPSDVDCPKNGWSWTPGKGCCTPHQPNPPQPNCPGGWDWDDDLDRCRPVRPRSPPGGGKNDDDDDKCDRDDFFFGPKKCCLPHGGPKNPPSPPPDTKCPPSGWYWYPKKGCCVPFHPPTNQPPPQCPGKWVWDDGDLKCYPPPSPPQNPPPQPSGSKPKPRRTLKSRDVSLCPRDLEACPITDGDDLTGDYECLDTTSELTSCGGCSSMGAGQDCTAIIGAWNIECDVARGGCLIHSCASGYYPSLDGKSCLPS